MATSQSDYTFKNWDDTLECSPKAFYQPSTEAEVIDIVREVESRHQTLRAFGAGHSWSPLVPTSDALINLDNLSSILSVDPATRRVTTQAGIRLKQLNAQLPNYNLAMKQLGSIEEQSISGAFSTATHGTGIDYPPLPSLISSMRIIGSGGRIIDIDAEAQPELMSAARTSLGAFGIITQVTLQCVPAHNLETVAYPLPFEEAAAKIPALIKANERVRLYWFANTDVIQVMLYNHTDKPVSPKNQFADWFQNIVIKHELYQLLLDAGYQIPGLVGPINQFGAKVGFVKEERVDRSDRIILIPLPPPHQETEYAVPVDKAGEALRLTRKLVEAADYKLNIPLEIRFAAADDVMLSPCYQRASCYVGAYTFGEQFAAPYFNGFEGLMKSLGGRPHWGKHITVSAEELRSLYPKYDRWNQIRKQLDPNGTFANDWIKQMFP